MAEEEDNTDGTYLDPYTGAVLGKAVGERFFDTVRSLHRYLLYLDRRRKKANARAARHPTPETAQITEVSSHPREVHNMHGSRRHELQWQKEPRGCTF